MQLDALRGYSGWGGCADAFSRKPGWEDINDEVADLLGGEESERYRLARGSVLTAYYTPAPVVDAMWDALKRQTRGLGDEPRAILEPGCGTGNFLSTPPDGMPTRLTGVELDPTSAAIAALLNPDADIVNTGLERCRIPEGSYDAAIGNVPYSGDTKMDYRLADGDTVSMPIHDYFIERAVDALRPGGTAVLLTSRHTLDKQDPRMREDLARKAELIAACRMPSSTFTRQAGTRAVGDVLVLRKRARTLDHAPEEEWTETTELPAGADGFDTVGVNRLIADDPDRHVAGDMKAVIGRWGGDLDVAAPYGMDDEGLGRELASILDDQADRTAPPVIGDRRQEPECLPEPDHFTASEYAIGDDGTIWYGDGTTMEPVATGDGPDARRLRGMIGVRDAVLRLQALERDPDATDADIDAARRRLNDVYDRFAAEFGHLGDRANTRAYDRDEASWHIIQSLESTDPKGRYTGKADIFTRRVIRPDTPMPDHCDTAADALDVSINHDGRVDLDLIARLTGTTPEQAENELGDLIIRDPDTGEAVMADDYLSGDVVAKSRRVHALAEGLGDRSIHEGERAWRMLGVDDADRDTAEYGVLAYDTGEKTAAEWIDTVGEGTWTNITRPWRSTMYCDPQASIDRAGYDADLGRHPDRVLALASKAIADADDVMSVSRTIERRPDDARDQWAAPQWHADTGDGPLWRRVILGDGTSGRSYRPALADPGTRLTDASALVSQTVHTGRLDRAGKKAILATLFDSMPVYGAGTCTWKDTPLGAAARNIMPDLDTDALIETLIDEPAISEYLDATARAMPQGTRLKTGGGYYGTPSRITELPADETGYEEYRNRRTEFMDRWRRDHADAIGADRTALRRLDHLARRLDQARPTPIEPDKIGMRLGAPWIPARDIHEFMCDTFQLHDGILTTARKVKYRIDYIEKIGQWRVGRASPRDDIPYDVAGEYGTDQRSPFDILEACLNSQKITITMKETGPDGKERTVVDDKATAAAIEKYEHLNATWDRWIAERPERRRRLARIYNERFNNMRPQTYHGDYLTLPGMNPDVSLRPHQRDAVARSLRSREGTLLAHVVGAGKTYACITAAHEARRLGKASKPLVVVPNHLVGQWADDWMRLYPGSRILTMDKQTSGSRDAVRRFWGRVATGDWDAVIVPQSRYERIHISRERRIRHMQERIQEYVDAAKDAAKASGGNGNDPTVKRLEAARKRIEGTMERLRTGKETADEASLNGIDFESLGVDMLVVDEAHNYKNLGVAIATADPGLSVAPAAKCEDMLDKCDWLRETGHGSNIIFATGTPVSNSISELYNMTRYLAPGVLEAQGTTTFSAWVGNYARNENVFEFRPEGGLQTKNRFAKFQNLPELMRANRTYMDIITNDDIDLDLPEVEFRIEQVPISDEQKACMDELVERAQAIHDGGVNPKEDNMLAITGDGRKIALDPKLLKGHESDPPLAGGKVEATARSIMDVWRDTADLKGTQLVFCDTNTPAGKPGWNVYEDLKRRLIDKGMPAEQIAFVHDAGDNPEKRDRLFEKVRDGDVRVLIGSTQKLGVGTNVQTRLAAIHDLDCPWRPADLEQRLGRIRRQGNMFPKVICFRPVIPGTFDTFMWQTNERKQRFIAQVMSGKDPAREASDVDDLLMNLAQVKASTLNDDRELRIAELEEAVRKLQLSRDNHARSQARIRRDVEGVLRPSVEHLRRAVAEHRADRPRAEQALATHRDGQTRGEWEGMTIQGRHVTDRTTACRLLGDIRQDGDIGEYAGFTIIRSTDDRNVPHLGIKGAYPHLASKEQPSGLANGQGGATAQLDRLIRRLAADNTATEQRLDRQEHRLEQALHSLETPWDRADEYKEQRHRLEELRKELAMDTARKPKARNAKPDAKNPEPEAKAAGPEAAGPRDEADAAAGQDAIEPWPDETPGPMGAQERATADPTTPSTSPAAAEPTIAPATAPAPAPEPATGL